MSYNFYVSDEYKHLFQYQQQPQPQNIRQNPIVYHSNPQQYSNHTYQPPNAFFPNQYVPQQPQVYVPQQPQVNFRYNHDSWAADQPNLRFSPQNMYPTLQPVKQTYTPVTPKDETKEIIHKIEYGDTLEGLSLIYDVPISKIKQRNNIQGDSIYYLKQVIIPNPKAQPMQTAKTQQFYIEEFITYMPQSQKSQQTARYYLQESSWNVEAAVKSFKEDLEWERKNKVEYKSIPIKNKKSDKINYSQQELLIKKYH